MRPAAALASMDRYADACRGLRVLDRLPDRERRRRHGDVAHAEVAQRIDDGADHHRERRRGAAFAAGLDAERIGRRQHLDDLGLERRQRVGARHAVIHERAAQRLAGRRLGVALLPHRLAHALRDAAMGLAVHDQRIDAAADVVDRGVARDRDVAGVGIDLDLADRAAVRKHRLVHLVVGGGGEAVLAACSCARLLGQLEEIEGAVAGRRREAAVVELDAVGRRVEHDARRSSCALAIRSVAALAITVPAWRIERPECEPPPTLTMSVSPMMMSTVSTGRCEQVGGDLREAGLVALAARLRADHHADAAFRLHRDLGALARRADRGLDVVARCRGRAACRASSPRACAA